MTRASLLHILHHVTHISASEVRELEQLAAAFPYCQTAHLLLAKAAHDQGSMLAAQRLRHAATYAANRELLRRLIETPALHPEMVAAEVAATRSATPENQAFTPARSDSPLETLTAEAALEAPPAAKEEAASADPALPPQEPEQAPAEAQAPDSAFSPTQPESVEPRALVAAEEPDAHVASPEPEPTAAPAPELLPEEVVAPEPTAEEAPVAAEPEGPAERQEEPTAPSRNIEPSVTTEAPATTEPEAEDATDEATAPLIVAPAILPATDVSTPTALVDAWVARPEPEALDPVAPVTEEATPDSAERPADVVTAAAEPATEALAVPEKPDAPQELPVEPAAATTEPVVVLVPDDLPALAPPIRQPADRGTSRFEYGFERRVVQPQPLLYQLPEDDEPASSVVPSFYADDALGYGLPGGSALGYALTAADLAGGPLPFETFFEPDALLLAHAVAHQPAPLPSSIDLINRFLKNKPRLKSPASLPPPVNEQTDLSVRSTSIVPELASESLAKILVKQGKVAKAIEIYERLMVRQPEKKAYFADQIQHLKPTE